MALRAVIYRRISSDRDARHDDEQSQGDRLGVARQLTACTELCEAHDYVIVGDFVDNDKSAFRRNMDERPGFVQMKQFLAQGGADVIVASTESRLVRQTLELGDIPVLCRDTKTWLVHTVQNGLKDMRVGEHVMMFTITASLAAKESENKSFLIQKKMKQKISNPNGADFPPTNKRIFGYNGFKKSDKIVINEEEAQWVRKVVDDYLSTIHLDDADPKKVKIGQLSRYLNENGVRTSTGAQWSPQTLGQYLRNPTIAGYRRWADYKDRDRDSRDRPIYKLGTGEYIKGSWDGIITYEQHRALVRAAKSKGKESSRVHPFIGVMFCYCGARMLRKNGKLREIVERTDGTVLKIYDHEYHCSAPFRQDTSSYADHEPTASGRPRKGNSISADAVDHHLTMMIAGLIDTANESDSDSVEQFKERVATLDGEIAAIKKRLAEAQVRFANDDNADFDDYDAIRGLMLDRLRATEEELAHLERSRVNFQILDRPSNLDGLVTWHEYLGSAGRIELAHAWIDRIVIGPHVGSARHADPLERIDVKLNFQPEGWTMPDTTVADARAAHRNRTAFYKSLPEADE